jgi:D-3-phosphoglycerate dehydrogenase / 2-oxoglutarate reductase
VRRLLVFSDNCPQRALADIPHPGIEVVFVERGSREQLLELLPTVDAYIASLRIRVDADVLACGRRLKLVATNSTGTDHLDMELLRQKKIAVLSNKEDRELLDQVTSTAELAFALILTCARHLPQCFEASRAGRWERHRLAGRQLSEKTLGIVGCGRLGSMMAEYGKAFRMRVMACDPAPKRIPPWVKMVELDELLSESDFVTLHVHLNTETAQMLGARELAQMKPGACLINTSRGGLLDENALVSQMKSGRIAAAGLDVIDGEWLDDKFSHPLIAYSRENPRLYITPHVGGATLEASRITARHMFARVVAEMQRMDARTDDPSLTTLDRDVTDCFGS